MKLATVTCLTIGLAFGVVAHQRQATAGVRQPALTGRFTSPDSGTVIPFFGTATGVIAGTHRHLWLVAQHGEFSWPVGEVTRMNNEWKAEKLVVLGLPSQVTYDLRLFDVPDTVHQRLLAVREDHDRSGSYRPILSRFLGTDSRLVASRRFVVE